MNKATVDARPVTLSESHQWCKQLSKKTAGNFYYSFLTLPPTAMRDMCVLYAFMRVTDDLGDDPALPVETRLAHLAEWEVTLQKARNNEPVSHPVYPALAELMQRHQIPWEYLHTVIEGVRRDQRKVRFETFTELEEYCYHVAGVVGLCCIHIWGFHDEDALRSAVDCGLAFQLTNILRDLSEDAEQGRIYLPREELNQFGYSEADLIAHRNNESFQQLMSFQVERAKTYYQNAERLFVTLEPTGKPILHAMMRIYGGLLKRIERCDYDVFTRRVRVPRWRKMGIVLQSLLSPKT